MLFETQTSDANEMARLFGQLATGDITRFTAEGSTQYAIAMNQYTVRGERSYRKFSTADGEIWIEIIPVAAVSV